MDIGMLVVLFDQTFHPLQVYSNHFLIFNCTGFKAALESYEDTKDFDLTLSNNIFVQEGFSLEQDFIQTMATYFQSKPIKVNFR